MIRPMSLILAALAASPAAAHPHVFTTAAVEIRLDDDGQLLGVGIVWTYDDFFSLLVTEDLGLDPDGDLILSAAEAQVLDAYITTWPADYEGDLYLYAGDTTLALQPVTEHSAGFTNGMVTEHFFRPLAIPQDTIIAPVDIQIYDPTYYIAYEVDPPIIIIGRDNCTATLIKADLHSAGILVDDLLYGRPASDVGPDEVFPEVGRAFADTVRVACAG